MIMKSLRDLELDLQSQDEKVVENALTELEGQELGNIDPRQGQAMVTHCMEKLTSGSMAIRAGALAVMLEVIRHGQYVPVGGETSASQRRSSRSSRSRRMSNQAEALAKSIQTPSTLDLKLGKDSAHYAKYHSKLCGLITELQNQSPRKFMPGFRPIGQYLVQCTGHADKQIATAACEYWAKLKVPPVPGKLLDHWVPSVLSRLQTLVPALLNNMLFHTSQVSFLEGGNLGENIPPEIEMYSNLRNYSALGFENLCQLFQNEITAIFKPLLSRWLRGEDWLRTEASMLALSAYVQACGVPRDMQEPYAEMQPRLIECFSHPKPLVRAITCFVTQQLIQRPPVRGVKDPFAKWLKHTIRLLSDPCPEVKVMASRSLSVMMACSQRDLTPFKEKLIGAITEATQHLNGDSACLPLYENIGYLFGRLGGALEEEDRERILQPVMSHWERVKLEGEGEVSGLCQPMCITAMNAGTAFRPYNACVLEKVCKYIGVVCQNGAGEEAVSKLVPLIDLISSVYEGQGSEVNTCAREHEVLECSLQLLEDKRLGSAVHQSALAVLGHVCQHDYASVGSHLPRVLALLAGKIRSQESAIRNNALWALTHITEQETSPHESMFAMTAALLETVRDLEGEQGCIINAALALTNLCALWPERTGSLLGQLFPYLCSLLQMPFPRDLERDAIFRNLCAMLQPNLGRGALPWDLFCIAAATLSTSNRELMAALTTCLKSLREHLGSKGWNVVCQQIGPQMAIALRKRFKLY